MPAYFKMTTLADRLQVKRQSIQRAIKRLVKRKILLRFYLFFHNKQKNDYKERAIILPHNPLKVKLNLRINNLDNKRSPLPENNLDFCRMSFSNRFNMLSTKRLPQMANGCPFLEGRGNRLISKLQKSLQRFRCIIYYIYSINTLYSNFPIGSFKRSNRTSFYVGFPDGKPAVNETFSFSLNERTKTMKRIPRYKLNTIPDKPPLINKTHFDLNQLVSSNEFDFFTLPENQKSNVLNYVAQHTYDFDFEKIFSSKKLNVRQPVAKKKINSLLSAYLELFFSGEPIDSDVTDKILRYWNDVDNPQFVKHKINHESINYIEIMIFANYMLKFKYNNDITKFYEIIDRFAHYGTYNHCLAQNQEKWSLNYLLSNRNGFGFKKYFENNSEADFKKEVFKFKIPKPYQEAAERWKEIFVDSFYREDRKKGIEKYNMYSSTLDHFLYELIERIKVAKISLKPLDMYKRSLVWETKVKSQFGNEVFPPILEEYCDWYSDWIQRKPTTTTLVSRENWMRFVRDEMRGVRGMKNFWYQKK
jgi:hypothetical protein